MPKPDHHTTDTGAGECEISAVFPLTVSSVQMEWTCVPNMTAVKIRKRRPSKQRRMRRMTVAGGEKLLHSEEGRRERGRKTLVTCEVHLTIQSAPTEK